MLWCVVGRRECDAQLVSRRLKHQALLLGCLLIGSGIFIHFSGINEMLLLALAGALVICVSRRFDKEILSLLLLLLGNPAHAGSGMGGGGMGGGMMGGNIQDYIVSGSMIQERVSIDGVSYWHQIFDDPGRGFFLEVFIKANGSRGSAGFVPAIAEGICGGGMGGMGGGGMGGMGGGDCNGAHPLDPLYGASSGNPSSVMMRQVVSDGEMTMEVNKPLLGMKHRITQTLNDGKMTANFILDATMIAINETDIKAEITNTLQLEGVFDIAGDGRWDIVIDGQKVDYSAGQWRYTPGNCADCFDGGGGTYDYGDGGSFDQYNAPWESFFNPSQEATNFWTPP